MRTTSSWIAKIPPSAVVSLGPDVPARRRLDELGCDSHAIARFAHAALDHVADPQLTPICLISTALPLNLKAEFRAMTKQLAESRQLGNDILRDAVAEILLFRIAAHVGEGQDRNRGFSR